MIKKGLIITNGFSFGEGMKKILNRYIEEFTKQGIVIDHIKNNTIAAYINGAEIKSTLGEYDFILYLDKDRHISNLLEKAGYRLFNCASSIELCDDKMLTHIALANEGIKMPKTVPSPLYYGGTDDGTFVKKMLEILDYPIIVKEVYGSFGKQVYKIDNEKRLKAIRRRLMGVPHLYQEFIKSSPGVDLRVICIGGKYLTCMLRKSETGDFRSNIELGGKGYKYDIDQDTIVFAEKVSRVLKLDYCGIDILFDEFHQPMVCEVNSNAFFNGIEAVTGENVAGAYVKHIIETIYKI